MQSRRHVVQTLVACALVSAAGLSHAQAAWPSKPITVVVPFPPGGSADVIARLYAAQLGERLSQTVVVENRAGANTSIGASAVARATPDGHTLMITGAPTFTANGLLYPDLPYDPVKSFDYVAIAGEAPFVIFANGKSELSSVKDLVDASAKRELSFGSFGTASTPHMAGEHFAQLTGASLLHVPYRGSAPAMTDLLGGSIDLNIDTLVAGLPHVRAGNLRAIALTSSTRNPLLPDVPTVVEAGVAGYDFQTWYGIVTPRGTDPGIVAKLSESFEAMMKDDAVRQRMADLGFTPYFAGPQAFGERVEREIARNQQVINAAGIKVE